MSSTSFLKFFSPFQWRGEWVKGGVVFSSLPSQTTTSRKGINLHALRSDIFVLLSLHRITIGKLELADTFLNEISVSGSSFIITNWLSYAVWFNTVGHGVCLAEFSHVMFFIHCMYTSFFFFWCTIFYFNLLYTHTTTQKRNFIMEIITEGEISKAI